MKWRRPDGRECASCPMVTRTKKKWLENRTAQQLETVLGDQVAHQEYMADVDEWEATRKEGKNTCLHQKVEAYQTEELTFQKVAG